MTSPLHSGTVRAALTVLALSAVVGVHAQTTLPLAPKVFSHADTLRGSNGPARAWWDAQFYDLHVTVNPEYSTIGGWNAITYRVLAQAPSREMHIDLQVPMQVDSIVQDHRA